MYNYYMKYERNKKWEAISQQKMASLIVGRFAYLSRQLLCLPTTSAVSVKTLMIGQMTR